MAKRSRSTDHPLETDVPSGNGKGARKRLKRLERELANLRATEAKRREQLTEVRARAADVRTRLAALRTVVAETARMPGSDVADTGPIGYCLRDKRQVQISEPRPVTLSNGRSAIAGPCSICGARVMVLTTRPAATDT